LLSFSGIYIAFFGYISGNGAAVLHLLGFLFFVVITAFASQLLKIRGPDLAKRKN